MSNSLLIAINISRCPNTCYHCEIENGGPQYQMSFEEIKEMTESLIERAKQISVPLTVDLVWKEAMSHPEYFTIRKYLKERFPTDDPLESIMRPNIITNGWSIARDPEFLNKLVDAGFLAPDGHAQLTLLGLGESHDKRAGRKNAFQDIKTAADRLIDGGFGIQWIYILDGNNVDEISEISKWAHKKGCGNYKSGMKPLTEMNDIELDALTKVTGINMHEMAEKERRDPGTEKTEAPFPEGTFLIKPQGKGRFLARPNASDLERLPASLRPSCNWCGAACETEKDLVRAMATGEKKIGCIEARRNLPEDQMSLVLEPDGNLYPKCHEIHEAYYLGNIHKDSFADIMERYRNNKAPALYALRAIGLKKLAAGYGKPDCNELHTGCSFCRTLVNRYLEDTTDFC